MKINPGECIYKLIGDETEENFLKRVIDEDKMTTYKVCKNKFNGNTYIISFFWLFNSCSFAFDDKGAFVEAMWEDEYGRWT